MQMRWSLITLFTLVAVIVEVCAAPVPSGYSEDLVELQARARRGPIKPKASNYRANARKHPNIYQPTPRGRNILKIPSNSDQTPGHKRDADHLLEIQTLKHALKNQGTSWENLDPTHQKNIQHIVNHQKNMAFIQAGLNRGKGQIVKHGARGAAIRRNPARDNYFRSTIPTAKKVARHVDRYLAKNGMQGNVHSTLVDTIRHSGVVNHGSTPGTSPGSSQHAALPTPHAQSQSSSSNSNPSNSHHNSAQGSPPHSPNPFLGSPAAHTPDIDALTAKLGQATIGGHHSDSSSGSSRPDSPSPANQPTTHASSSSSHPPPPPPPSLPPPAAAVLSPPAKRTRSKTGPRNPPGV